MRQEKTKTNLCIFCEIVQDIKEGRKHLAIENKALLKTDNFFVIPALGPLVEGHILVISKTHFDCLASMGYEINSEYNDLIRNLSQHQSFDNNDFLEFEHGSKGEEAAGASIIHCHVHILPNLGHLHNILDDELPQIPFADGFNSMFSISRPHIWIRRNISEFKCYLAENLPSQFLRRKITHRLGNNEWDWRKYPHRKWVETTVNEWT